ncbi:tRNA (adenosine(37)-N6)-threonylcarbamoyltransferase complex dimerization subunit type 1 TsaB [Glycomyces niveus]|jgi:tRNA threonylcarbamoyl adenosine modification protein YeaZ|uniref:tRNA (Adenosine(37)-N6)-threonylcarbamoyltransferase complex dimerization subunit type 1 TsaB n=1 Tax=Glycomyces niveus TaxID=2820287 RepID=A0ABS3UAN6_9ACTN|nr:tRNA (adenosine(37)-N6)-threonylcarbamoyltransferase complex dimerization subunit type 1 TsaB [Glycomyces sp. NEAU-S30]MBO3735840.1 tRNA (adenosine(37)-N6)-threonylcarbamoyltransferase complex dimerization subunit type 1 TsaB [Glycomyces sp. NEAU-S30]
MRVLAIDTSTAAVQAALVDLDDDELFLTSFRREVDARGHVEKLAPFIEGCLADAGRTVKDVDAVVAGIGPGPFTGLRVGMVTAAAFADGAGIPVYGVCSLDGIGANTRGRALAATDARRKEIYWAVYEDGVREGEPQVGKASELPETGADYAIGEGASKYAAELPMEAEATPIYPDLVKLVELAGPRLLAGAPSEQLTPLYLRRPDAQPAEAAPKA